MSLLKVTRFAGGYFQCTPEVRGIYFISCELVLMMLHEGAGIKEFDFHKAITSHFYN